MSVVRGVSVAGCALVLASGCGGGAAGENGSRGPDVVASSSAAAAGASSATPGARVDRGPAEPQLVDMVAITAAGGEVTTTPTPVDGEVALAAYLAGFDPRVGARLRQAVGAIPAPRTRGLTATVVHIGCDSPTEVDVLRAGSGYEVRAVPPPETGVQCFAPVTSVALIVLPSA